VIQTGKAIQHGHCSQSQKAIAASHRARAREGAHCGNGNASEAKADEEQADKVSDWPSAGEFAFFLALGLLVSWVKMLAGVVAAVAIRNAWVSVGVAIAIAVVEDLWPVLDTILTDRYALLTAAMSGAGVLLWWVIGRGLARILRRPPEPVRTGAA
jgi:hypothetical protein